MKKDTFEILEYTKDIDKDKLLRMFFDNMKWVADINPMKEFSSPVELGKYMSHLMYLSFIAFCLKIPNEDIARQALVRMLTGAHATIMAILDHENIDIRVVKTSNSQPPLSTVN